MTGERDGAPTVMTVCGPVPGHALGHVQPHEHLISDSSDQALRLHAGDDAGLQQLGIRPEDREQLVAPLDWESLRWVRRHAMNTHNLRLAGGAEAAEALTEYAGLGGTTIVDCTSIGLGRDPVGLRDLSVVTGVNIVMGCGFYVHDFHPANLEQQTEEEISATIVADLTVGADGTGVRAGIIGEIGLSWPPHPDEIRVLRAAARAQRLTGAGVQVHPGRHPDAPASALDVLEAEGADLSRVSISHIDRTIADVQAILDLAARGCFIELDMFGQESCYYPYGQFEVPNDAGRATVVARLLDAGRGDQILVSQDLGYRSLLSRFGGPGYGHILRDVLPLLARRGVSADDLNQIVHANPRSLLLGSE